MVPGSVLNEKSVEVSIYLHTYTVREEIGKKNQVQETLLSLKFAKLWKKPHIYMGDFGIFLVD